MDQLFVSASTTVLLCSTYTNNIMFSVCVHFVSLLLLMHPASDDYIGGGYVARFVPSLTTPGTSSVEVPTNPDNVLEGLQYFSADLSVPTGFPNVQEGVPSIARVNITDTTSKCL